MRTKPYQLTPSKWLTDDEIALLVPRLKALPERDQVYFETLLATGARASELLNVLHSDLDRATQSVFLVGLKGCRDRSIPLPSVLFERLWALDIDVEGRLFPVSLRRVEQVWHIVRPVRKKLHGLRHTFAVRLYKKTRDLVLVQRALGHTTIRNTAIYTEIDTEEDLRKALVASA